MSNCIIFALGRWLRSGGHVVIRKSHYGWWPHLLWSADLVTFEEYVPLRPNHDMWLPPIIYRGFVRVSGSEAGGR